MSAALRVPAVAPRRWLVGPVTDLLFGCGLAYAFVFAAHALAGAAFRDWIPFAWLPIATLLVSTPHYGATLLRVYEDATERRLQARIAVWATAALCVAFWFGLRSVAIGSLFVTLYLTWSPWHYTAQNYGVAMVLLRRRGAAPSPTAVRLLYASFICSFALAFVSLHGQASPPYYPDSLTGYAYYVRTLGIPPTLRDVALALGGLAWLGLAGGAATLLVRGAGLRATAPALSVMLSQTLWFVAPALARNFSFAQGVEPLSVVRRVLRLLVEIGRELDVLLERLPPRDRILEVLGLLQELVVLRDRLLVLALGKMEIAAVVVCVGVLGLNLEHFVHVGDGPVLVLIGQQRVRVDGDSLHLVRDRLGEFQVHVL
jgi:hypothetical protein